MSSHICIVGCGFSGAVVAVQLLRGAPQPDAISIFDASGRFGPGLAYGTSTPTHLLNVRASGMSALPDQPAHFLEWARARDASVSAHSFLPRGLYGRYIEMLLRDSIASARATRVELVAEAVEDVLREGDEWRVITAARAHAATHVVFALGNRAPAVPLAGWTPAFDHYIADPWANGACERIAPTDAVLCIGTGLTMVDIAVSLAARGHTGVMTAVSTRGLLPQIHQRTAAPPTPADQPHGPLRHLMRAVRAEAALRTGGSWHSVVDGLRPQTPAIWQRLTARERAQFMRHVRPFWDVRRHRMAPEIGARVHELQARERLRVRAARIVSVTERDDGFDTAVRPRGGGSIETIRTRWIVNCTGPASDLARANDPLTRNLLARGLLRADAAGLGLECGWPALTAPDQLYWVGPFRRSEFWEATAAPELRAHAAETASAIRATLFNRGSGAARGAD